MFKVGISSLDVLQQSPAGGNSISDSVSPLLNGGHSLFDVICHL
jgi:hypothetical protein